MLQFYRKSGPVGGMEGDRGGIIARASKYVAAMPPAVSGEKGSQATFAVAVSLAHGFALTQDEAWPILCEYNDRCTPPWSEAELLHKLDGAGKLDRHPKPKGHLAVNAHPRRSNHPRPPDQKPRRWIVEPRIPKQQLTKLVSGDDSRPLDRTEGSSKPAECIPHCPLDKVEETGYSDAEVPTVPIEKILEPEEEFLTVAETHARNWLPHAALFEWTPVPIECQ